MGRTAVVALFVVLGWFAPALAWGNAARLVFDGSVAREPAGIEDVAITRET